MKKETVTQIFYRYLDENVGRHYKIAEEAGISQAAISRHYRRQGSPRLSAVEAVLALKAAEDKRQERKSARRLRTKSLSIRRPAAAASLAQQGE